jgi:hypothetical protein
MSPLRLKANSVNKKENYIIFYIQWWDRGHFSILKGRSRKIARRN